MQSWAGLPSMVLCAGLVAAVAGCSAPTPAPQATPEPPEEPAAKPTTRIRPAKCEQPNRPRLTEAQKAALFQDFDAWQRQRDPATADAPVPPPSPLGRKGASRACRVSGA